MKNWYRIENKAADEATIYVYDEISSWGISANQFVKDLGEVKAGKINLRINSPGGNVFDGVTIYNALKEHPAQVNVKVDGLAASIASIIAMAGDTIHMAKNAMFMVHKAWSLEMGNADAMHKMGDVLDKIDSMLVKTYADRTGKSQRAIKQMMTDETWMSAEEAKAAGFADTIGDPEEAKAAFDLSRFAKVPSEVLDRFAAKHSEHTERDIETLLRDAGVSRTQAKAAVAAIKAAPQRDAEAEEFKQWCNNRSQLIQVETLLTK